jgi:flagellar capping protein FliD
MKVFGYWTLAIALAISGVAAYYSIIGLTAIFAAAVIPIVIMGSALEVAKVTTAVWLHRYWHVAPGLMKFYLTIATIVLMFITSMGIFGFLSKAHIEQTSMATESVAQIERIVTEIGRNEGIISRAEQKIVKAEASTGNLNEDIQAQIDKEQGRIDSAYSRVQPAIDEQNAIIQTQLDILEDRVAVYTDEIDSLDEELSRLNNLVAEFRSQLSGTTVASIEEQVQPYKDQIAQLDADLDRINTQANEYEARISEVDIDNSALDALQTQITAVEQTIIKVTNQLQSTERGQIQAGQAVIGVTSDGLFGGNTQRALNKWVDAQQKRITQLQSQALELRTQAQATLDTERTRLTDLVKDLRGAQTVAIQDRKQSLLEAIDSVRAGAIDNAKTAKADIQIKIDAVLNTDIPENRQSRLLAQDNITSLRQADDPRIVSARESITQLRQGADAQIAASNDLIQRLRERIRVDGGADIDAIIDEQQNKIREANNSIDILTEEKYSLEAENRKLEAEVGPVKYIAEMVYGDQADTNILEQAVRWVILLLVAVFDPLAIVLVLAGVMTIHKFGRKRLEEQDRNELENETTNRSANSSVQNDNVESDERTGKANNEADIPERSAVEKDQGPVPDSTPEPVATGKPDPKKIRKPAKPDAGEKQEPEPKKKKDHPDNSWLNT